ncbi:MAG: hypothetical protein IJS68_02035 [Clostridia bacterium]|nr:hypothetical protein [Clostridia bacterium]
MSGTISAVVASVALAFLILGFVFGWVRGYQKSLARFIIVLVVAVVAFFITPALTNGLLTLDISGLGIKIGGGTVTSVKDLITQLINSISQVKELVESSPTLKAFIDAIPAMIVNVLLFTLLFFLLKWISMIIYGILAATVFNKKKMEGKNKIKLLGAGIGVVQALLTVAILLIPLFGFVNIASNLNAEAEAASSTSATAYAVSYNENVSESEDGGISLDRATEVASEYVSAFRNTWIVKVYSAVGVDKLSVSVFDKLSEQKVNNVQTNLTKELTVAVKMVPSLQELTSSGMKIDSKFVNAVEKALDTAYESDIVSNIVNEVIVSASTKWSNGETFIGMSKPAVSDDASVNAIVDTLLSAMKNAKAIDIESDLKSIVNVMNILVDQNVFDAVSNGEDAAKDVLEIISKENSNIVADLINALKDSPELVQVLPKIINTGLDFVYDALETTIPEGQEDQYKISENITSMTWGLDAENIQSVLKNIASIYSDFSNKESSENTIEVISLEKLGIALNSMRNSAVMNAPGGKLLESLLNSEMISSVIDSTTRTRLINAWSISDTTDPNYVNYASTFKGIGDMVEVAKTLSEASSPKESIEVALNAITSEGVDTSVMESLLSSENLQNAGLDADTANAVSDVVNEITDGLSGLTEEEKQQEIEGIAAALDIIVQTQNAESGTIDTIDSEAAEDLVDAIAGSTIILDLIDSSANVNGAVDTNKLDSETKTNLEAAIDGNSGLSADQKDALKAMLGI